MKLGEEEDLFSETLSLDRKIYIEKEDNTNGFSPHSPKDKEHFCLYLQSFGPMVGPWPTKRHVSCYDQTHNACRHTLPTFILKALCIHSAVNSLPRLSGLRTTQDDFVDMNSFNPTHSSLLHGFLWWTWSYAQGTALSPLKDCRLMENHSFFALSY